MSRRPAVGALAIAAALAIPGTAAAARYHVGLSRDADPTAVAAAIQQATGSRPRSLAPFRAFAVDVPTRRDTPSASYTVLQAQLRGMVGVAWVEPARVRRVAFAPTDPLAPRQWYATANRAYDAWPIPPSLAPVRVAVIDSGVDLGHPELERRIVGAKSFVGGTAQDTRGHGTIVAGIIAAELDNQTGIAGLAPAAELLVAKVVAPGGTISVEAEAKAIRWAVDRGARIVNISLGGLRDPRSPDHDTFSLLEQEAVAYAVRKGVLVVAAVGNADQAPDTPWRFASYPAALPHVLGVSAVTRSGASPSFSNRDAVYNDVAAPGEDILSTFPRALTQERRECVEQGYTPCASADFRPPDGTSFAAPQVTAIAANLLGVRPRLRPEQVAAIVERTAVDAQPLTGCKKCPLGRDEYTGWGAVDGTAAVEALRAPLPARDGLEPNDDAGDEAYRLYFPPGEKARVVKASVDYWDDQDDLYAVYLRRGERLYASLVPGAPAAMVLALWRPDAVSVRDLARQHLRVRLSNRPGPRERLGWRADEAGWHFLQARLTEPTAVPISYRLRVVRTR